MYCTTCEVRSLWGKNIIIRGINHHILFYLWVKNTMYYTNCDLRSPCTVVCLMWCKITLYCSTDGVRTPCTVPYVTLFDFENIMYCATRTMYSTFEVKTPYTVLYHTPGKNTMFIPHRTEEHHTLLYDHYVMYHMWGKINLFCTMYCMREEHHTRYHMWCENTMYCNKQGVRTPCTTSHVR